MENQTLEHRGRWGSKVAFILAATGSAIGLGNIWRFPWMVSENGGAVFVFVYILAVALIGFPVMLGELTIGRHSQKNAVGAFEYIKPKSPWKLIGYLGIATGLLILSFYAVIAGWAAGYLFKTVSGAFQGGMTKELTQGIYDKFTTDPFQVFLFFIIVIGVTTFIVSRGVKGGLEKWTKILLPLLFVLIVYLAIRAITLPGAAKGLAYYLKPDFSKLNGTVILMALGQAFFSLSLGMGTMITYGSYISKSDKLVSSAGWVSFSDTLIAILAGLIIFPTLFAFQGSPGDVQGESLVFLVFPLIFSKISGGFIFGILFFSLLFIAAITSTISLLEVPVAYFIDERGWSRNKAAWLMGGIAMILGIPSALSSGISSFFQDIDFMGKAFFIFGNLSLAIGAFFICIFLGYIWKVKNAVKEITSSAVRFRIKPLWIFAIKFLAPIAILVILYSLFL